MPTLPMILLQGQLHFLVKPYERTWMNVHYSGKAGGEENAGDKYGCIEIKVVWEV